MEVGVDWEGEYAVDSQLRWGYEVEELME